MRVGQFLGLIGIAVTIGVTVFSLSPDYVWMRPYLLAVAVVLLLASLISLFWPFISRLLGIGAERELANLRYRMVCEALDEMPLDAGRREWLARLMTGARPGPITQHVWDTLQQKGIVEGDFHGPKGLTQGFESAIRRWLKKHPLE